MSVLVSVSILVSVLMTAKVFVIRVVSCYCVMSSHVMRHLVVSMSLFVFGISVIRYCVYPYCFVSCHFGSDASVILCCIMR